MPRPKPLVHQSSISTGSGNLTLAVESGKQSFATAYGTGAGNPFDYYIAHRSAAEWEYGQGYMSDAATLVRATPLKASSGVGVAVNFTAGGKDVASDYPPEAIANEHLAQMNGNTIKGREATTGDVQDLTAAQVRTIINVADGATNYVHPNHTGDVTSVGGGATTIVAGAVSNAKLDSALQTTIGSVSGKADTTYVNTQDALRVLKSGDTMSGTLAVQPAAGEAILALKKAATGTNNSIEGWTGEELRWRVLLGDGSGESGANAGSNFSVYSYDDNGALIAGGPQFSISRATGNIAFGAVAMSGNLQLTSADPAIILNKAASGDDARIHAYKAGVARWVMQLGDPTAESGVNNSVGSDFRLSAYDDAGFRSTPIIIPRATGAVEIRGTNTNDSAAAGYVGEYKSATVLTGSAVALTTVTYANLTSLSLTAGDWDVYVNATFDPAATTNIKSLIVTVATASATPNFTPGWAAWNVWDQTTGIVIGSNVQNVLLGPIRISLAATATYYANAWATFTVSTLAVYGIMSARRVR
jgi:hypothetical protein